MSNYSTEALFALRRQVAHEGQLAEIQQITATNGPASGARYLVGRTVSGLRFKIAMDRGFDLEELEYQGAHLGWVGPAGSVGQQVSTPDQEGGTGLLRAFTGFMLTCGYDYFGPARQGPADHFGYVLREKQHYPLHGRASFLPADLQIAHVDWLHANGPTIVLQAEMRQVGMFGEALINRRRIEISIGTPKVTVEDIVTNAGLTEAPHQILYHLNLGYPLIGTGTQISGLPEIAEMPSKVPEPTEGETEKFRFVPRADCAEKIAITNATGTTLSIHPASPSFKHIGQWWNNYPGMGCVGIEPASAGMPPFDDTPWAPERYLQPGERETYLMVFEIGSTGGQSNG